MYYSILSNPLLWIIIAFLITLIVYEKYHKRYMINKRSSNDKNVKGMANKKTFYNFDKNGNKRWYLNSKPYKKNNLIAIEYANGDKYYCLNNKRHRDDDLPAIEKANGDKYWYLNDELHRENDFPAVEKANGDKIWYLNGKYHREKGPAFECANGKKEWCWHGRKVEVKSQEEFEEKLPYLIMKDINEQ